MKFTLPISPEYVSHWGLWEAVREIYQNALDEQTRDPDCKATIEHGDGILRIATSRGSLSPETLVLGKTSKRDDERQRGKFGEGYKLALLVLNRLGHDVEILTGSERWTSALEHSETFNSTIMNIYTEPNDEVEGVQFIVSGVSASQWAEVQKNIQPVLDYSAILEQEREKGRIYVGGLYVSTVKGFECGYAFTPGCIKLDRDRGMVDGFDLAYETSRLWEGRGGDRAVELLNAEAPDVEYVESHAHSSSPIVSYHSSYFYSRHGDAIPVSNQDEIERATSAGVKWVLVPEKVKSLLRLVRSWFIPSAKDPVEQLRDFRKKHQWRMSTEMKADLDEIIHSMDPQENAVIAS